jgi:hypothetical protein
VMVNIYSYLHLIAIPICLIQIAHHLHQGKSINLNHSFKGGGDA